MTHVPDVASGPFDGMSKLVRNSRVTRYEYDLMSRKTNEKWCSATGSPPAVVITNHPAQRNAC